MSGSESWLGEFELGDKWSFCLTAAKNARESAYQIKGSDARDGLSGGYAVRRRAADATSKN